MLGFINRNKAHQIGAKTDENIANNVYLRDFYIKDFKYISPEALGPSKVKVMKLMDKEKSMVQKWLEEVLKGLKQFFYGGSLHGVKYIFEPTFSFREKMTWVVIMVISVIICAINITQLISKWTSSPFVNVIDSVPSPVWAIPFPTVVLCPHLHVKLAYDNVSQLDDLEQFFATLVCPRMMDTKRTSQRLDLEQMNLLLDFILKASPTCEDVLKTCNWPVMHAQKWETENCCDLFQPIFTNYGLCYAFNSLPLNGMTNETLPWQKSFNEQASPAALEWGLDIGYPKTFPPDPTMTPLRVMASGETNGLGLELYLNTSDHQFGCDGNSLGFTVLISSPTDHVYTSTVIRLPMDRMTTVEVYPLTYKTDSSLRSLTPAQRQCFFQNERQLEYFEFYTDSNCKHDFLVQEARNMCDCVLFNWPRKLEGDPVCSTNSDYECINKAKGQQLLDKTVLSVYLCFAKVEEQLIYAYYAESDELATKDEYQSCHPSCNDVIYSSQVFYSDLTKDLDRTRHWGQPKVGEVTQINVHFYDDMFLGQHRHAQYDHYYFVDLSSKGDLANARLAPSCGVVDSHKYAIGQTYADFFRMFSFTDKPVVRKPVGAIGGLLSLFLGFSIISVAELVYFVILKPAYVVIKEAYCVT